MLGNTAIGRLLMKGTCQLGVSLIEIMIGLIIVSILLMAGFPSFTTYIKNSHIRNTADGLQNGLNLARSEAVRRNTNVNLVVGDHGSWVVGCDSVVVNDCPQNIQSRTVSETSSQVTVETKEVIAETGATAIAPLFSTTLGFNGFGQVSESKLSLGNNAVIDVYDAAGSGACVASGGDRRCLRLVISGGGQVRMCDPALQNNLDPRAC